MIAVGLTWREAIPLVLVGGLCNSIPIVLNGAMGARLRVAFPVSARASFGYWFSYFCVVSRLVIAMFWFGVNSTNGASCITQVWVMDGPKQHDLANVDE